MRMRTCIGYSVYWKVPLSQSGHAALEIARNWRALFLQKNTACVSEPQMAR